MIKTASLQRPCRYCRSVDQSDDRPSVYESHSMGKGLICAWWHSSPGQIPPREFVAAWRAFCAESTPFFYLTAALPGFVTFGAERESFRLPS